MKKVSIIALQNDKPAVTNALIKAGVIHIIDLTRRLEEMQDSSISGDREETGAITGRIEGLKFAIEFLSKYDARGSKKAGKPAYSHEELRALEGKGAEEKAVKRIYEADKEFSSLKNRETLISNRIEELKPWENLDIQPEDMDGTSSTVFLTGSIAASVDIEEFKEYMGKEVPESYIEEVNRDSRQYYLLIAFHGSVEEKISELLKSKGFSRITIKDLRGTVREEISMLESELGSIAVRKSEIESELKREFAPQLCLLKALYDYLNVERDKREAVKNFIRTEKTFMLEGWVPYDKVERLEAAVKSVLPHCWMEASDPSEGEEPPVLLRNNPLVEPFELITELYSLPNTGEVDPNALMAPFYAIFFGIMVSDAGYGLAITILAAFVLLKLKPEGLMGKLTRLLFLGGISTTFWGALFGGWFGNIFPIFGVQVKPLWFDPLEDPLRLLIFSFILGVIHLFVGMGIKAYKNIRDGHWLDAIFDQGFWYVFLLGLIFLLVPGCESAGKYMSISGAVLLVLTQGRSEKNIFKKLISGIISLYGASGFLSDVLSYSRLLALGLGTGVIAVVINTMGTLMGFNILGYILLTVVFVIGHTFNILINTLGAYVHSSRLQYVEFFGKFYEGGGKAYRPLAVKTKYININGGEE